MDEITISYRARHTIIEMLEDRGYSIPKEYLEINFDTFRHLYTMKNYDIICSHSNNQNKIYVKFIHQIKIKPNSIREFIDNIYKENLDSNDQLIFVLKIKPNNSILKIPKEKDYKNVEIKWLSRLQFNITKHELVPSHTLVSDEELNQLRETYNLTNLSQLPKMSKDDPISKYYNYKVGQVCKIERPSKTSSKYIFYRYIR